MAKFLIWTWTGWRNQQTNAHQKRPYKPRKLFGQGGVAMQWEVRVTERTSERTSTPSQSRHQIHPPSCYSQVHFANNIYPQNFFHKGWKWWAHNRFSVVIAFNITKECAMQLWKQSGWGSGEGFRTSDVISATSCSWNFDLAFSYGLCRGLET